MINPTLQQKLLDNGYTGEMSILWILHDMTVKGWATRDEIGEWIDKQPNGIAEPEAVCNLWLELNKK